MEPGKLYRYKPHEDSDIKICWSCNIPCCHGHVVFALDSNEIVLALEHYSVTNHPSAFHMKFLSSDGLVGWSFFAGKEDLLEFQELKITIMV